MCVGATDLAWQVVNRSVEAADPQLGLVLPPVRECDDCFLDSLA